LSGAGARKSLGLRDRGRGWRMRGLSVPFGQGTICAMGVFAIQHDQRVPAPHRAQVLAEMTL